MVHIYLMRNWYFYLTEDLNLVNTWQEISKLKTKSYKIFPTLPFLVFSTFGIPLKYNWCLNIALDGKGILHWMHIIDFHFFSLKNQKLKKDKWQCSQNFNLNPTYVFIHYNCVNLRLSRPFAVVMSFWVSPVWLGFLTISKSDRSDSYKKLFFRNYHDLNFKAIGITGDRHLLESTNPY